MSALVLHVRLHDGRYHGEGDWPPSPARLFQALVAGAGLGGPIGNAEKKALEWLEKGVAGKGLRGHARLEFSSGVRGPVLLGRSRYLGGGLFSTTHPSAAEQPAATGPRSTRKTGQ